MGDYVQSYGEKASIVVATERYTQHVTNSRRTTPQERLTVADFAIVKAQGFGGWVGFRDVVEADGVRIADHEDRLLQVLQSSYGSMDEARRLSEESARFNIGPIVRNFNVPTTALFFFTPASLDRFKFTRKGVDADGIWEIGFREAMRPTLIRTPDGRPVATEGTLRVNGATGTIVRTVLRMTELGVPRDSHGIGRGGDRRDLPSRAVGRHVAAREDDGSVRSGPGHPVGADDGRGGLQRVSGLPDFRSD